MKKPIKKILSFILLIILFVIVLGLVACNKNTNKHENVEYRVYVRPQETNKSAAIKTEKESLKPQRSYSNLHFEYPPEDSFIAPNVVGAAGIFPRSGRNEHMGKFGSGGLSVAMIMLMKNPQMPLRIAN